MDIALAILAIVLVLAGIIGSFLPVLPGPPLAWLGILAVHFTAYEEFSGRYLLITALIMLAITGIDYLVPIWGAKHFGGSRAGVIGTTVGLLVGLFLGPAGIISGPFAGALIGEVFFAQKPFNEAFKSAIGSFFGFLIGTGLKLIYCGYALWVCIKALMY